MEKIGRLYKDINPTELTEEDETALRGYVRHICGSAIREDLGIVKVRDHDHLTGRYRDPDYQSCNLNYQLPDFVPVFLHNLSGCDAHLLVRTLVKYEENIDIIPNTEEKYVSFAQKAGMRFVDTFRFMASSLVALAKNLEKG